MANGAASAMPKPMTVAGVTISAALLVAGLAGGLSEGIGYGLFLVSALLLASGLALFGFFFFSRKFDSSGLKQNGYWLLALGGWFYVFGFCALGGFYALETLEGRMETRWIIFGPVALASLIILDRGIYRVVVKRNLPTFQRFGRFLSREQSDPAAMRRTLVDEVLLHRTLRGVNGFRWFKHTLIYWGFALLVMTEGLAVLVRDVLPAWGYPRGWEEGSVVRLALDFSFEVFGLMVLAGCALALVWRVMVNGTEQQKYTDTPTALFLFVVILSGFFVEGLRFAAQTPEPYMAVSFAGYFLSGFLDGTQSDSLYEPLWYLHVIGSCLFIAYVPLKRLVHSCATPLGRLANSQTGLLEAKRQGVIRGLLNRGK